MSSWAFGSYVLCCQNDDNELCQSGDIAVVISKTGAEQIDLLFENGKTVFDLPLPNAARHFRFLFCDPHFVVDGCSTNPGWAQARAMAANPP